MPRFLSFTLGFVLAASLLFVSFFADGLGHGSQAFGFPALVAIPAVVWAFLSRFSGPTSRYNSIWNLALGILANVTLAIQIVHKIDSLKQSASNLWIFYFTYFAIWIFWNYILISSVIKAFQHIESHDSPNLDLRA